jgi:replicative DNA helicase
MERNTMPRSNLHQLLPQSEESEKGILSCILIAPQFIIPLCREKNLIPDHFHIPAHGLIYETLLAMEAEGKEIDPITLTAKLRQEGKLEHVGGPVVPVELRGYAPSAILAASYIEDVQEKRTLREVMRICAEYEQRAQSGEEAAALLETLTQNIDALSGEYLNQNEGCVTQEAIAGLWQRFDQSLLDDADGVTTGIAKWDEALGGLRNGRMYALGARPSVGKTSLIEMMVSHLIHKNHRVVVIQRDMPVKDMLARMACRDAGETFEDFDRANLPDLRMNNVRRALQALDRAQDRLRIHSPPHLTPECLRAIVSKEWRSGEVAAVFVDVFQRMTAKNTRGLSTTDILTEASKGIRDMSIEFNIPFLIVAHLNAEVVKTKRPNASQFAWCGQLFNDADVVVLLWSEDEPRHCYNPERKTWRRQTVTMTVDKNRGGCTPDETIYFDRPKMRFYSTLSGNE